MQIFIIFCIFVPQKIEDKWKKIYYFRQNGFRKARYN